ncbi:NITRATE FORMATE IRON DEHYDROGENASE [Salix purpurea]|uniref:CASP-like protein n=1 Tax=Salix purpurea TaxID=77065 RepID=A0A9Q0VUF7_SALPP|nr:NITRATE FORMATE IRON DEHYDROGENASE [Salix purpurea]
MASSQKTSEHGFFQGNSPGGISTASHSQGSFIMAQITIRFFAIAFTLAAIPVMITAEEPISLFGMAISPSYKQSSAMKFLLGANATVCAFTVLSLLFVWPLRRSGSKHINYFLLHLHDMVMTLLLMSGCSAATAVGYLSQYGQPETSWSPICDIVKKFCHQILISTVLSYLAFFCYLALDILSVHKLLSRETE